MLSCLSLHAIVHSRIVHSHLSRAPSPRENPGVRSQRAVESDYARSEAAGSGMDLQQSEVANTLGSTRAVDRLRLDTDPTTATFLLQRRHPLARAAWRVREIDRRELVAEFYAQENACWKDAPEPRCRPRTDLRLLRGKSWDLLRAVGTERNPSATPPPFSLNTQTGWKDWDRQAHFRSTFPQQGRLLDRDVVRSLLALLDSVWFRVDLGFGRSILFERARVERDDKLVFERSHARDFIVSRPSEVERLPGESTLVESQLTVFIDERGCLLAHLFSTDASLESLARVF